MFTGIIAAVGHIHRITPLAVEAPYAGVRLSIHAPTLGLEDVQIGDSIAINGACMTVVAKTTEHFEVDVSHESLSKTVGLSTHGPVNLEKALRLQDRIGGHLTTGHIDSIGTVVKLEPLGESWQLVVQISKSLARYCAVKGSITINGVSLTVNTVSDHAQGCDIRINLIPHTWQFTTMNLLKIGSRVNVEIDLIARYMQRMLSTAQGYSQSL